MVLHLSQLAEYSHYDHCCGRGRRHHRRHHHQQQQHPHQQHPHHRHNHDHLQQQTPLYMLWGVIPPIFFVQQNFGCMCEHATGNVFFLCCGSSWHFSNYISTKGICRPRSKSFPSNYHTPQIRPCSQVNRLLLASNVQKTSDTVNHALRHRPHLNRDEKTPCFKAILRPFQLSTRHKEGGSFIGGGGGGGGGGVKSL